MSNRLTAILCLIMSLFSLQANSFNFNKPKYERSPLLSSEFNQLRIKQGWANNSMVFKVHNGLNTSVFCSTVTIFHGEDKYTVNSNFGYIKKNEIGMIEAVVFENSSKVTAYQLNCTCLRNKKTGVCDPDL